MQVAVQVIHAIQRVPEQHGAQPQHGTQAPRPVAAVVVGRVAPHFGCWLDMRLNINVSSYVCGWQPLGQEERRKMMSDLGFAVGI